MRWLKQGNAARHPSQRWLQQSHFADAGLTDQQLGQSTVRPALIR
jgi:hypothetical protein